MLSDRDDDEDDGYQLQPEETQTRRPEPASASAAELLRKAEAEAAAQQEEERSSADRMKESVGGWWQRARVAASGLGQGVKTLAEAGSRKAEAATIKTVALPKAYAALGRAVYQDRRYLIEFPVAYRQRDELVQQLERRTQEVESAPSLLERAKQSVRRAADAATAKSLSVKLKQQLQRLGADCFERFGAASGPPELCAAVQSLLSKLHDLQDAAD